MNSPIELKYCYLGDEIPKSHLNQQFPKIRKNENDWIHKTISSSFKREDADITVSYAVCEISYCPIIFPSHRQQ